MTLVLSGGFATRSRHTVRVPDLIDLRLKHLQHRRILIACAETVATTWIACGILALFVVLVQKLALPGWSPLLVVVGVAVGLAPLPLLPRAWYRARRDAVRLGAELDARADAQGLAMALAEQPPGDRDGDWLVRIRRSLEDLELPPLPGRRLAGAVLILGWFTAFCFVPERQAPTSQTAQAWKVIFANAEQRLAEADQRGLLPQGEAAELRRRLEQLRDQADAGGMTQAGWEALDRVEERIKGSGNQALEQVLSTLVQAARMEGADPKVLAQQAQQLAASLGALAKQTPGVAKQLESLLDPALLNAALAAAKDQGLLDQQQVEALRQLGLDPRPGAAVDPAALRQGVAALRQRLEQAGAGLCPGGAAELRQRLQGRWGVDRGPGHAPLGVKDPAPPLKPGRDAPLPPGAILNPDGSITLAMRKRDAEVDTAADAALLRARAVTFDADAADARRVRVAPRQRGVVGAYFARTQGEGTDPDPSTDRKDVAP